MRQQALGALIGAGFGTAFVFFNAGSPVPGALGLVLRILAVVTLAAVVALGIRARRLPSPAEDGAEDGRPSLFGKSYRLIVLAELIAFVGAFVVLRAVHAAPEAPVAVIALIVGIHFLLLGPVWHARSIAVIGGVLSALGVVGLILLATPAITWTPFVSGVLSGATLLTGSLLSTARATRA